MSTYNSIINYKFIRMNGGQLECGYEAQLRIDEGFPISISFIHPRRRMNGNNARIIPGFIGSIFHQKPE